MPGGGDGPAPGPNQPRSVHGGLSRRRFLGVGVGSLALSSLSTSCLSAVASPSGGSIPRQRLRQLGITIGQLPTGPHNAITDVAGVHVGHATRILGEGPLVVGDGPVRSGVTAILPRSTDHWREPVAAADWILNGNGELTGTGPIRRTGQLAAPILLTDTGSVGSVYDGALEWMLSRDPLCLDGMPISAPVVGETWANTLHDTGGRHIGPAEVAEALNTAASGPVVEGCVGGGTGMRAFAFKAGIGTSSRQVEAASTPYQVGVLVQANVGGRSELRVDGVPVGEQIDDLMPDSVDVSAVPTSVPGNSLLVVVATDAPLLPTHLHRLCRRAALGAARTGTVAAHGSGDLLLAFSTAPNDESGQTRALHMRYLSRLYQGVVESTQEAILNSLTMATTMVGRDGNRIHALPLDRMLDIMRSHGRL